MVNIYIINFLPGIVYNTKLLICLKGNMVMVHATQSERIYLYMDMMML